MEPKRFSHFFMPKHFNLTAILQSGQYYLNDNGLLVAPNGTLYRIPSGPPEGRKPLRPHKPISVGGESTHETQQHDVSGVLEPRNTQLGRPTPTEFPSNRFISDGFNYPSNRLQDHSLNESHLLLNSSTNSPSIEWNIVLFTLVLSSISLACNVGFVGMLVWKLCRWRTTYATSESSKFEISSGPYHHLENFSIDDMRKAHEWQFVETCSNPQLRTANCVATVYPLDENVDRVYRQCMPILHTTSQNTRNHHCDANERDSTSSDTSRKQQKEVNPDRTVNITMRSSLHNSGSRYMMDYSNELPEEVSPVDGHTSDISCVSAGTLCFHVHIVRVFSSLAIHIGLLSTVLSLTQLLTVCGSLVNRMSAARITNPHDIICIVATSSATDTILCARHYLMASLVAVNWISSYWIRSEQSRIGQSCTNTQNLAQNHQQRIASIALVHSLPWALAAGTALILTFTMFTKTTSHELKNLDSWFRGLETLIICHTERNTKHVGATATLKPTFPRTNFNDWPVFLSFVIMPVSIQIVSCLIYVIVARIDPNKETHSTNRSSYAVLLLLVSQLFSFTLPMIWSTTNLAHLNPNSSNYIYRLIAIHQLIDPWPIFYMLFNLREQMEVYYHIQTERGSQSPCSDIVYSTLADQIKQRSRNMNSFVNINSGIDKDFSNDNFQSQFPIVDGNLLRFGGLPIQKHVLTADSSAILINSANSCSFLDTTTGKNLTIINPTIMSGSNYNKPEVQPQLHAQLCEHHQSLLEQKYLPTVINSFRTPEQQTEHQRMIVVQSDDGGLPIQMNRETNHVISTTTNSYPVIHTDPLTQNKATATVIAAAAAAVAAHAQSNANTTSTCTNITDVRTF